MPNKYIPLCGPSFLGPCRRDDDHWSSLRYLDAEGLKIIVVLDDDGMEDPARAYHIG